MGLTCGCVLFGAVSVIVVVASGLGGDESVTSIERALRSALGADAVVAVRRGGPSETDEAIRASADAAHATLIGVVTESDEQHATIRFARPHEPWSQREIRFDPTDAARERSRTIGFAIASVIPDETAPREPKPEPPSPPPLPHAPAPAPHEQPALTKVSAVTAPWLDAFGMLAAGIDGFGGGGGGGIGGRLAIHDAFRARVALGVRGGEVPPAQASSRTYLGSLGLAWQPWLDENRRWGLGGRADFVLIGTEVAHFDDDDPKPDRHFRVVPGADLAVEGTWRFTPSAAFIAAIGAEVAMGKTSLYVRNERVAELVPVRALGELGLRVFF